ncbi:MAG: ATP-dependent helicase [bacterium]
MDPELCFEQSLTRSQLEAVTHIHGPLLVLAGAGSGKTRVITYRITYLVKVMGMNPWNILAVTFTNKAAETMQTRLSELLGDKAQKIFISTIHAACVRILRNHSEKLDRSGHFLIFDKSDQISLMKKCIEEANLPEKGLTSSSVLAEINRVKNNLISCREYEEQAQNFFQKKVALLYSMYEDYLKKNDGLDFADLIIQCVDLFRAFPDVLEYYHEKLPYILVDEYQDTNYAQSTFLDLLAQKYKNICVVGDDDQSIYKWRGAEIKNVLNFENRYPGTKIVYLEQNYRSTHTILAAAEALVSNNETRKKKKLWTKNEIGEKIYCFSACNGHEEANFICGSIKHNYASSFPHYGNFVVLYRTNAQSRIIEEALRNAGIPYLIVGGLRFYERKEIKDLIAYLRVINNPKDDISLSRIINVPPRGIGGITLERLNSYAQEHKLSLFESIEVISKSDETSIINSAIRSRLQKFFLLLMNQINNPSASGKITPFLKNILEKSDYKTYLEKENSDLVTTRMENIDELVSATIEFDKNNPSGNNNLAKFLDQVALVSETDEYKDTVMGRVTLMTIHSAKGMEFPVVFIAGMEEGLFPYRRSLNTTAELEEERRLCYVGMTRAKKKLLLSWAARRNIFGTLQYNKRSRFLDEIPNHYIYSVQHPLGTNRESRDKNTSTDELYSIGSAVYHSKFGRGIIRKTDGKKDKMQLIVDFNGHYKRLLAKYAKLKILTQNRQELRDNTLAF